MSVQSKTAKAGAEGIWLDTLTGSRARIRTPGVETKQKVTVIEYTEPPNSTPPVFTRHEFIEVFCVLDGTLTFQFLDEPPICLAAGQSITCPAWKPHSFWNTTNTATTVLLMCTPAGLDEFFIESDKLLRQAKHRTDNTADAMKALRTRYGLEHVGEPPDVNRTASTQS